MDIESQEVQLTDAMDLESEEVDPTSDFTSPHPVATPLLGPPGFLLPVAITPPPPPPAPPLQHPIIVTILKDDIASILLKYQLPTTALANVFTLISGKSGRYESTGKIMLGLLALDVLAFIAGKVLRKERPVIAAVAELTGISLSAVAFIYPMSVLLGGPVLCFVPPIIGVVVAGMYIYRLATGSGGNTDGASA